MYVHAFQFEGICQLQGQGRPNSMRGRRSSSLGVAAGKLTGS